MSIDVKNVTEIFVEQNLKYALDDIPGVCKCEQCVADIKAITLNSMPVKYVSTTKGEVLTKLRAFDVGAQAEFIVRVRDAARRVKAQPHHELTKV